MDPIGYDEPQFLEPAHFHDPVQLSHIITLPTSLTDKIPNSFREALAALQESTSVAFASSQRLQALVGDLFHRVVPAMAELNSSPVNEDGKIKCRASESNQFCRDYANATHHTQSLRSSPSTINFKPRSGICWKRPSLTGVIKPFESCTNTDNVGSR